MDRMRCENSCQQHNLKRSYSAMSRGQSSSTIHHHDFSMPSVGGPHSPTIRLHSQPRFHGDGLDLRRPVTSIPIPRSQPPPPSSVPSNFIDLTGVDDVDSESSTATLHGTHRSQPAPGRRLPHSTQPASRFPRYPNQIIDLEDEVEQDLGSRGHGETGPRLDPSLSPEVEFLHARTRRGPLPPLHAPQQPAQQPLPTATGFVPTLPAVPLVSFLGGRSILNGAMTANYPQPVAHIMLNRMRMNYNAVGFNLAQFERPEPPPATPTVEPLPSAREGFTRSPREDDVLICPGCWDELSVGDDEVKRQVWVVKACGHVYCGECAKKENRPTQARKKAGKAVAVAETKKFSNCVVEGCGKPVSGPKTMIQLFL